MDIEGWDKRYRCGAQQDTCSEERPTKLVVQTAGALAHGTALDLACGLGRNSLWLAQAGWDVTAIDGSAAAIKTLRERARLQNLKVRARVEDLQSPLVALPEEHWDLIAVCYYLQRDLLERVKRAAKPGGTVLVIVHTTEGNEEPTAARLRPGELAAYFADWDITRSYEGPPDDPAHKRLVAEIVARRPSR